MRAVRDRFQLLHEFVKAACTNLKQETWGYLIGGAELETTLERYRGDRQSRPGRRCGQYAEFSLELLGVESFEEFDDAYLHPAEPVTAPHVTTAFPLLNEGY